MTMCVKMHWGDGVDYLITLTFTENGLFSYRAWRLPCPVR